MEASLKIDHFKLKASPLGKEMRSSKCGECDDYDGPELERHLAFVHGLFSPYPCRYCEFTNRHYNVLKVHRKKKHKTRRGLEGFFISIRCAECTEYNGPNILEHLQNVHGLRSPFRCSRCLYSTGSYVTFKNHRSTHCRRVPKLQQIKSTKCWECDDYDGPDLRHHLAQAHGMTTPFKCSTCLKVFSTYGNLLSHRKAHGQPGPKPTPEIKCEECEEYEGKQVHSHLKTVHGLHRPFKCPQCQYSTQFYTNYKSHRASHMPAEESSMINQDAKHWRRLTKCEDCDDYDGPELYSHLLEAHNLRRPFKCSMCSFTGKNYSHLKYHRARCSRPAGVNEKNDADISLAKQPVVGKNQQDVIQCGECNEHDGLNIHDHLQDTHNMSRPFKCSECDYITDFYTNFKIHQGSHWPEKIQGRKGCKRLWKCRECDEYDGPELYAHLLDAHGMRKPFKCSLCDKEYIVYANLVAHRKSHLKERSQGTKCGECNYEGADLEVHLEDKHGMTPPYKCIRCNFKHKSYSSLVTHRKTHKKEITKCEECQDYEGLEIYEHLETTHGMTLPFPCSICSKTFMSYSRLKRHHDPLKNGGWCGECDVQIDTDLKGHLESVHQLKSPFQCHICNVKHQSYSDYKFHKQKKHGRKKNIIQVQSGRKATKCWECTDYDGPDLMEHLESLHGIKTPFKCRDCTFACKFYSRFSEHRKSHVQHKCQICGIRYDFKCHLTTHMEKQHGQPKPKPPLKQSQVLLTQPYTCPFCQISVIKVEQFNFDGLNEPQNALKCPSCGNFLAVTKLEHDSDQNYPDAVQMAPEVLNVTKAPQLMDIDRRNGEDIIHMRKIQTTFQQQEGPDSLEISPTDNDSNYDPLNCIKLEVSQFEMDFNNDVNGQEGSSHDEQEDEQKVIWGQDFFCTEESEPLFI